MAYPLGTDIDTSLEGKVEDLTVGTLRYDFLVPPPTGTSKWAQSSGNPNNIYNISGGSVGIGVVNPVTKLEVDGDIKGASLNVGSGAVSCGVLNYGSLNPPVVIPPSSSKWEESGFSDTLKPVSPYTKIGINNGFLFQNENLYVNGSARVTGPLYATTLGGVFSGDAVSSINGFPFDYYTIAGTATWTGIWNSGASQTCQYRLTRNGMMCSLYMSECSRTTQTIGGNFLSSNYFINGSQFFPNGNGLISSGQTVAWWWDIGVVVNDNSNQLGVVRMRKDSSTNNYRLEIYQGQRNNPAFWGGTFTNGFRNGFNFFRIDWSINDF